MSDKPKQPSKWIMQTEREQFFWVWGTVFGFTSAVCLIFLTLWFAR
jgi:hypothetical protein